MQDIKTLEQAFEELDSAEEDCRGDFGEEGVEAGWSDLVESVAMRCEPEVAKELCRIKLGWVPMGARRVLGLDDKPEPWLWEV